jgi:hypothetical protein
MVYAAVYWLNGFPDGSGISDTMSPREIVLRQGIGYHKHCQVEFGSYVQTHEEHDNSMVTRTTGAIALQPTGNAQGGHCFFSLTSGRVLNQNHWTTLPMPQDVIVRVHSMSGRHPRAFCSWTRFGKSSTTLTGNSRLPTTETQVTTSQEWRTTNRRT